MDAYEQTGGDLRDGFGPFAALIGQCVGSGGTGREAHGRKPVDRTYERENYGESAARTTGLLVILATAICASAERLERNFASRWARLGDFDHEPVWADFGEAGPGSQVIVIAVLHSDQVEIDHTQSGNRVDCSQSTFFPGRMPTRGAWTTK